MRCSKRSKGYQCKREAVAGRSHCAKCLMIARVSQLARAPIKGTSRCRICGEPGHNARTCEQRQESTEGDVIAYVTPPRERMVNVAECREVER